MSKEAMQWALDGGHDCPRTLRPVLWMLAWSAQTSTGCNAFPSVATLAKRTGKSERQVRYDLKALLELGLIRRGNQKAAAYIRADRRPVVYDLALERGAMPDDPRGATGRDPGAAQARPRGATPGRTGCNQQQNGVQRVADEQYFLSRNPEVPYEVAVWEQD